MKVLPSAWCSIPKPTSPAGFLPLYCSARPVHSNPEYILVPTPAPDLLHHLSMPSLHYHLPGQPQHSMVAPQHQPYSIIYSSHDIFGGFLQCKSEDVSSFCLIQFSRHIWGANSDGGTSFHSLRMQPWLYIIFSVCPHESTPPRDTWLAGTDSSSSCLSRPFPRSLLGTW